MNISDIEVANVTALTAIGMVVVFLGGVGLAVFGMFTMSRVRSGKPQPRRAFFVVLAVTLVAFVGGSVVLFQGLDASRTANENFARELQEHYGASASKAYETISASESKEAWLTRDGQETLVRFVTRDGKITPYTVLSGEYPRAGESL